MQEPAHVLGVGRDGLDVIEDRPALGQDCPRPLCGGLKALLTLLVVSDAMGEVGHVELGRGLHEVVEPVEPAPHVGELRLDGLQPLALVAGHVVHLLVHDVDQAPNVALGQDVGANQADDQLLELSGVNSG